MASRVRPERRGPGRAGATWGWNRDRSRAPVLTVHRGEGVCFAVHIHGEAEEWEQRGRRRRVASQTQLQDLRRKGRGGGGGRVSGRPAAGGQARAGGRRAALHAGTPPGPLGFATAAAATCHRWGTRLGSQQSSPRATGWTKGHWGRMARAPAAARAEAG